MKQFVMIIKNDMLGFQNVLVMVSNSAINHGNLRATVEVVLKRSQRSN